MGVEESAIALKDIAVNKVNRNFFEFQYVVGKGGFGKVYFYLYYFGLESSLQEEQNCICY